MTAPARSQDQYIVRFPSGMRAMIKDAAAGARRSMNAEIIHQLERAYGLAGEAAGQGSKANSLAASGNTGGLQSAGNVNHG